MLSVHKPTFDRTATMKGAFSNILKQAQQMQTNLQQTQEELEKMELTGEAGGGMVKLIMSGGYDTHRVVLDPGLLTEGTDKEMLEDLIAAAVNDAVGKVEAARKEKMSGLMGGLNLPPGMKLPF
jgi:hypothetical protein